MGSYYKAYTAFYAVPYVSQTMLIWGGVASIISAFNLARFLDRNQSVVRAYLFSNRTVVRLELGRGQFLDVPISGINFKTYNALGGILSISANGKNLQLKLKNASFLDPVMIYAVTNPTVSYIDGTAAEASQ